MATEVRGFASSLPHLSSVADPGALPTGAAIPLRVLGAGPPVLLLHGCPVPGRSLAPLADAMAASHQVWVPELSGLGLAFEPALDVLVEALRAAGITSAAVVGHSGGAYRALQLALDGRIEVTRLVLLSPTAWVSPAQLAQFAAVAEGIESGAVDPVALTWEAWFGPTFRARQPGFRAELAAWFDALGPAAVRDLRVACLGPDLSPVLPRLRLPVTVLAGALDAATPVAAVTALAARVPQARLTILDDCGHFPHLEQPARATAEVLAAVRP